MCGDCFVCIYLVCQCDGLELGRRNRRITVRGVAVRINRKIVFDLVSAHYKGVIPRVKGHPCWIGWTRSGVLTSVLCPAVTGQAPNKIAKLI